MAYSTYSSSVRPQQQQPQKKKTLLENTALLEQLADRRQRLPESPESLLNQLKPAILAIYGMRYGDF